jgi:phosphatidylinositol alpha-1,6-mannosyltransferase
LSDEPPFTTGGILLLLSEAFHRPGGIQTYHRGQLEALKRCGVEPLSVLVLNDTPSDVLRPEWAGLSAQGFSRNKGRFAWTAARVARRQRPRHIVFGHRNFLRLAPLLHRVAASSECWLMTYGVELEKPLSAWERRSLRSIARVFAISPQTAEAARRAGYPGKVELWPCGLSSTWAPTEPVPSAFGRPCKLLTVSRLAPPDRGKGIDHTIQAVGQLVRSGVAVTLDVVGDGEDRRRLEDIAKQERVGAAVVFHGQVDPDRLRGLYAGCDLFVLPSRGEGFGIVFLEAMAFGKPVVAADAAGAPFVVRPDVSGFLVPYGNPSKLARCIEERVSSPEQARLIGLRGRRFVEETFSFDATVRRTREIMGQPPMASHSVGA